ncbi:hypothetical protein OGAPHI_002868 [Ogataea philodendri]|uniref:Protein YIP n=1 Tax=Ogataea philodendri TaxID=1378263 RepID=A0A9P8T6B8_9ASCO|nr:uncharacterized protein OGAPHI_002868 [Ogataea philodendri]KAH3667219.1 hypothetical protein OGAPHI_002868 [Ogataea philodendri]
MSRSDFADFSIDDDNDLIIQPDNIHSRQLPVIPDVPSQAEPAHSGETADQTRGNDSNFLNFSNFVNPQSYLDPILGNSNVRIKEKQFSGGNTLDESVITTLNRDVSKIGDKLLSILWPLRLRQNLITVQRISSRFPSFGNMVDGATEASIDSEHNLVEDSPNTRSEYSEESIRKILDWDLWGPLVFVLAFSLIITRLQSITLNTGGTAPEEASQIFSASFSLIWIVISVLSVNIQLVSPVSQLTDGGDLTSGIIGLSFFQCVSFLSYTLFPIILGGLSSVFVRWKLLRLAINSLMFLWSITCSWLFLAIINNCKTSGTPSFLSGFASNQMHDRSDGDKRMFLMIYPIVLVYGLFSWLCVIV